VGSGVDLSGVDLSDTDLTCAELMLVDLSGANLTFADLRDADLFGADLNGAIVTPYQLKQADSIDAATIANGQLVEDWLKSRGSGEDGGIQQKLEQKEQKAIEEGATPIYGPPPACVRP
jgi:hypothetical protein